MEAKVVMRRTASGLVPDDDDARAALAKLKPGDRLFVKLHRPRSIEQHRLFWALLAHVAEATEWETPEKLLVALKMATGRYDLMKLPSGKVVPVPQSISFSAMPQDEFQRFFDQCVKLICEQILGGMAPAQLIADVQTMLGPRVAA